MKKELKLVKNEGIKESSNGLRGTIHEELMDSESIKFTGDNQQVLKSCRFFLWQIQLFS